MKTFPLVCILALGLSACAGGGNEPGDVPLAETADEFVARINAELDALGLEVASANWVRSTYLNADTAVIAGAAAQKYAEWLTRSVTESTRYDGQEMSAATARAIRLLRLSDTRRPTPADPARRAEFAALYTELGGMYGSGRYCPDDGRDCLSLRDLERTIAESRDPGELEDAWVGWRTVSAPMRSRYPRFVELANEGARDLGYRDLGEMWRDGYDMTPDEFSAETVRLWNQVKPLYEELHCHARAVLAEYYGEQNVPLDRPIPAHLLGNMWSQSWAEIYDLLEPYPGVADLDTDRALREQNYSPEAMVKSAEDFYVSLGLPPMPQTFWERSMFSQPADRDVVCHGSAWQIGWGDDLRIKMCVQQNLEDLRIIYHELGHNYYYAARSHLPPLFQAGAHPGFDEAVGDAINLSMTPAYLHRVGLLDSAAESDEAVINEQMLQALRKIAFLPFGILIDEWRWRVFSGEIAPADYNKSWWELRARYQGIAPPVPRSEEDFDAGAKYHVPGNISYTRYFLAHVLQFQFQRALCDAAGDDGPLHECSIYGSTEAGLRLQAMLAAGASEPWQDTLEKLSGKREMDATAIVDYFQPLMSWLEEQNAGRSCGW